MAPSFFEGPEKKVELMVEPGQPALRSFGRAYWDSVVQAAGAQILDAQSNGHFDAYLLSESSLFVYDTCVTMITCGQTRLVDAVELMLERIGAEHVGSLFYERKNEHFPHEQPTAFLEDAARLGRLVNGVALRFGTSHEHTVDVFHTTRDFAVADDDTTLEVLMHGISDRAMAVFREMRPDERGHVAARLGLDALAPGFDLQEYIFEPAGYSLNGQRGEDYLTLHVTPQRVGSYVSFETSMDMRDNPSELVRQVVELFHPESFDVMAFVPDRAPIAVQIEGYRLRKHVHEHVVGHAVTFQHFFRAGVEPERALRLTPAY